MLNKSYSINDIFSDELYPLIKSFEEMRSRFVKNRIPFHIDGEDEFQDKYYPRFWEYASVIHFSKIQQGMKILDAGSGYSILAPFLAENGIQVWANDISLYWKERKKQMKEIGKKFTLDLYDLSNTHYPDAYFDRIFCVSVIEHIPEAKIHHVLLELNRILKIGGILAVTFDFYTHHIPYSTGDFHGGKFCQYFSFDSIKEVLLKNTGFELVEPDFIDDTDWNNPPLFNQYNFARLFLRKIEHKNKKYERQTMPVRVGHISFDFYYGGIQEQIQILAEHSNNEKFEHFIIACGDGPLHQWADTNGIPHAIIDKDEIATFCEAYQIKIIFTHIVNGTAPHEHLHAYELFLKNIPIINVHYCSYRGQYPGWLFDHIITNAQSTVQYLPRSANYSVIPLAINTSRLEVPLKNGDIKKKWGIPEDSIVIGRLSRLEPTKMVDHTITAMSKIKHSYNNPLIFFIGGGEALFEKKGWYETLLKEQAAQEKMEDIIFTGPIYGQRKAEFLHIMDINLAPTSFEGYGLIFVEPAYCGVPTVTYDHSANMEVVSEGGIIVPFGDIDSLVKSTLYLINNPELRKKIGIKAMETVLSRNLPIHWCTAIENLIFDKFILKDPSGTIKPIQKNRPNILILITVLKIFYLKNIQNAIKLRRFMKERIEDYIKNY